MTPSHASFDPAKLDQLGDLIDRMLRTPRNKNPRTQDIERRANALQKWSTIALVALALAIAVLALVRKWSDPAPAWAGDVAFRLAQAIIVVGVSNLAYMMYLMGKLMWRYRKQPDQAIFANTRTDLKNDARYLDELGLLPRPMLEYALLQYQHHGDELVRRVTLLAGDIAKIGLFPGFLALSVSALKLAESQTHLWFWMPLILAASFYLFAFAIIGGNHRRTQVIRLLQYAIEHAPRQQALPQFRAVSGARAPDTVTACQP